MMIMDDGRDGKHALKEDWAAEQVKERIFK